ncbi:MAG TPA: hypothetical protein VGB14_03390 [Acidimicrobiales bacterium]
MKPLELQGDDGLGLIRYRLSYRTLVAPERVDELLVASGLDPAQVWLKSAMGLGSRPDRIKTQLQLQYDRRNQIAHEGDWDAASLEFRKVHLGHVGDCLDFIKGLVMQFDSLL